MKRRYTADKTVSLNEEVSFNSGPVAELPNRQASHAATEGKHKTLFTFLFTPCSVSPIHILAAWFDNN